MRPAALSARFFLPSPFKTDLKDLLKCGDPPVSFPLTGLASLRAARLRQAQEAAARRAAQAQGAGRPSPPLYGTCSDIEEGLARELVSGPQACPRLVLHLRNRGDEVRGEGGRERRWGKWGKFGCGVCAWWGWGDWSACARSEEGQWRGRAGLAPFADATFLSALLLSDLSSALSCPFLPPFETGLCDQLQLNMPPSPPPPLWRLS